REPLEPRADAGVAGVVGVVGADEVVDDVDGDVRVVEEVAPGRLEDVRADRLERADAAAEEAPRAEHPRRGEPPLWPPVVAAGAAEALEQGGAVAGALVAQQGAVRAGVAVVAGGEEERDAGARERGGARVADPAVGVDDVGPERPDDAAEAEHGDGVGERRVVALDALPAGVEGGAEV